MTQQIIATLLVIIGSLGIGYGIASLKYQAKADGQYACVTLIEKHNRELCTMYMKLKREYEDYKFTHR